MPQTREQVKKVQRDWYKRLSPERRKGYYLKSRKYLKDNPHVLIAKEKRRKRRRERLNTYKVKKGCSICGYNSNPLALQFDHIYPQTKLKEVSKLIGGDLKKIFKEIRKCRVLCANCHMILTHGNGMIETENTVLFEFKHHIELDKGLLKDPSSIITLADEAASQMREAVITRLSKYWLEGK